MTQQILIFVDNQIINEMQKFSFSTSKQNLVHCFDILIVLRKGQTLSSYYRMMACQGGFCWLQTCAHLMAASKTPNDQCIVAVHTLIR
jgi:hypothetical protein